MTFARYTNCFAFLTFILLLVPACEPEEDTPDAGQNDATEADTLTGDDPASDASDSQDAECDRFCVFNHWLDAFTSSTYVGCVCETMAPEVTALRQSTIDSCLRAEEDAITAEIPVETDCVEALTDEQLQEVIELTTCYFDRNAQVSPCVRAMQAGDLCSSCEQFESPDERFPCTSRPETSDRIASCVDGIPGFL